MTVLRFSNYEKDTIAEHQAILNDHGYTYWGWWKKRHEPWPQSSIDELSEGCKASQPRRIGLVERQAEKFYVAECVSAVSDSDKRMPSPEPSMTPEYYREKLWPLWLKLVSIQEVPEATWCEEFGDIPRGDETFFDQSSTDGVDLIHGEAKDGRTGILHLSDLHFGDDFGFNSTGSISKQKTLIDLVTSTVPCLPLAIVISGDLTTRGSDDGLRRARQFIETLAERLDVPRDCVIIAPGNHDILIDDQDKIQDFSNEQGYRDLVSLFYGRSTGLERVHAIRNSSTSIIFGVLNSSRPRTRANMDYGYVGRDRSEPVMQEMNRLVSAEENSLGFLVLHHHVQPAPQLEFVDEDRPVSVTLDAGEIISFAQRYGVRAILHGHQHLPFVGTATRVAEIGEDGPTLNPGTEPGVLILGAGAAGVQMSRLGAEFTENSFAFYTILEEGHLKIQTFRYNPIRKPQILWDFTMPV